MKAHNSDQIAAKNQHEIIKLEQQIQMFKEEKAQHLEMMRNRERDIELLETSLKDLKLGFESQLQRKTDERDQMKSSLDDAVNKNGELIHLINQKQIEFNSMSESQ